MGWDIRITEEAIKDLSKLDGSIKKQVLAGIYKVSQAPWPSPNGYGKPLGNRSGNNLTGFFKIKHRDIGIRIVYTLVFDKMKMNIVVISARDDDYCYKLAAAIYKKYGTEIFDDIFEPYDDNREGR